MPQAVEKTQESQAKLPPPAEEPRRLDIFSYKRKEKNEDYSAESYSQNFKELIDNIKSNFNYAKDHISYYVKGDDGYEKYCVAQLDSIILTKGKALSPDSQNYQTELRFLATLYKSREEIKGYDAQPNVEVEKIRKKVFEALLPKEIDVLASKDLFTSDKQLRYITYAAFISKGDVEMGQVQELCRAAAKTIQSFSKEHIKEYFKQILTKDDRVVENAEPYKQNELFAGTLVAESDGLIPAGKFIYRVKDLFTKSDKEEYVYDFVAKNGEKWRLGLTSFDGEGIIYLRNLKTGAFASLEAEALSQMLPEYKNLKEYPQSLKIAKDKLNEFLEKVAVDHALEGNKEHRAQLLSKDLRQGETGFFAVYPKQSDPVITSSLLMSVIKEKIFAERYDLPVGQGNYFFVDNPMQVIEKEIDRQLLANPKIKVFFIDINSHGSNEEFKFETPLKIEDLAKLFNQKKYKDRGIEFNIETLACFGAGARQGLVQAYKEDPSLKVSAFMHSKPYVPNMAISAPKANPLLLPKDHQTSQVNFVYRSAGGKEEKISIWFNDNIAKLHPPYMEILFLTELMKPKSEVPTLGTAYHNADLEVRKYISLNPEAVVDGVIQTGGEKKEGELPKFER